MAAVPAQGSKSHICDVEVLCLWFQYLLKDLRVIFVM